MLPKGHRQSRPTWEAGVSLRESGGGKQAETGVESGSRGLSGARA